MTTFGRRLLAASSSLVALVLVSACNPQNGSTSEGSAPASPPSDSAAAGAGGTSAGAHQNGTAVGGPGASVQLGVITLHPQSVPISEELPGRTVASAVAEIRPQVSGIIQKRVFQEGTEVKAGDVLYQIDDRTYKAALESAKADVDKAEAAIPNAQAKVDRYKELLDAKGVSKQDYDDAKAALLQANASLASTQAALQTAEINLDNTEVKAPISGPIGTSSATEGALVTASQTTALATIRQIDPIYVDMTVASSTLQDIRRHTGPLGTSGNNGPTVSLAFDDDTPYAQTGRLISTAANVDEGMNTVTLRASFANPDHLLLPGMYIRAKVDLGSDPSAFLLPQRAVGRNTKGEATAVFVSADNKANIRVVAVERPYGRYWVVRTGIQDGDRIAVDGLQNVRGGDQQVTPVAVELDGNDLVREVANADTAPAGNVAR